MNSSVRTYVALIFLIFAAVILLSCGSTVVCAFHSVNVSGSTSVAVDHSALPPGNQARFTAFGNDATAGCAFFQSNLMNVTWTVSDTQNVSISNTKDATYGVATCINATTGPVTVTATLPSDLNNGTTATGTSNMTCK